MDVRSQYALRGYAAARQTGAGNQNGSPAKAPGGEAQARDAFGVADATTGVQAPKEPSGVSGVAQSFVDTVMNGDKVAQDAIAGRADALSMVEALAATELAMETAVTVRDRVVEAYQEILRMPV